MKYNVKQGKIYKNMRKDITSIIRNYVAVNSELINTLFVLARTDERSDRLNVRSPSFMSFNYKKCNYVESRTDLQLPAISRGGNCVVG